MRPPRLRVHTLTVAVAMAGVMLGLERRWDSNRRQAALHAQEARQANRRVRTLASLIRQGVGDLHPFRDLSPTARARMEAWEREYMERRERELAEYRVMADFEAKQAAYHARKARECSGRWW
jgi:hypothetical protein